MSAEHAPPGADEEGFDCPGCLAVLAAEAQLLAQLAAEQAAADALDWTALCNSHAWRLRPSPPLAQRLAATRLSAALDRMAAGAPSPPDPHSAGTRSACPCCTAGATAAAAMLERATADGGALCLPHLTDALRRADHREATAVLCRAAAAHFDGLAAELSEAIRRADYRFRDEARGPEAMAWLRALRLLGGAPGVRWSLRRDRGMEG